MDAVLLGGRSPSKSFGWYGRAGMISHYLVAVASSCATVCIGGSIA
jgi:hypothetical protein